MFNKMSILTVSLLVTLFFSGCGKESLPENIHGEEETGEWPTGQNVFVAGFENIQDEKPAARLWKNGKMVDLAGSTGSDVRSAGDVINSVARSVFVSGNDVYVAGYDIIEGEGAGERTGRARLWKNGEVQELEQGTYFEQAVSVFVSGDDVYVLGAESLHPIPSTGGRWAYKYWKNGKAEVFAERNGGDGVNSIFVTDDGDVYIAGQYGKQAKLWKNGVEEDLAGGEQASSVFVTANDIYVAGFDSSTAKFWKNGKMENLTNGTKFAKAYSVFVFGNDVYVAGYEGDEAKLWKNGIVQDIADNKDARMFLSVFVSNGDIYTSGYVVVEGSSEGNLIHPSYLKATLWRNGKKLNLNTEGKNNSQAMSIFVK